MKARKPRDRSGAGKLGDGGEEFPGVVGRPDFDELASADDGNTLRALATGKWNNKLECRVRGGEADDFYVLEPGLAARGKDIVFRDVLLALGIDDPESGSTRKGFCDFGQIGEVVFSIGGEENVV